MEINNSELLSENSQVVEPQLYLFSNDIIPNQFDAKDKTNVITSNQIENRRYIGNKTKLLTWLGSIIEKETKDCKSFYTLC